MDISWIDGLEDESGHGMLGGHEHKPGNVYEVEHLATFQLSEELTVPADGMRRLLHMEKNGFGIWSQKMRVRLESRFIVILDFENGEEMERFPLHLIRDPTAFTNPNPGELYNNIFAFIVHPVEMHIFQCFNISAAELVEDVKMALTGRVPPPRYRRGSQGSLPPPPNNPPPDPPMLLPNHEDRDVRDDTSSGGSEGKYEREVNILNRCFDDIERFIARLQYAAAAWRELQRRRKTKKSKKKEHGEGLMSLRAKPPRERDFVDILQKFKLSFNLLARLKSHIHDPNAPELVHFLFTPLALIVDASRDAHTMGLAACVVAPLLSREAIELLNNCLTSKETELWHSLGEAWLLSREQFKGYVPPYQPVFMDGWTPTVPEGSVLGQAVASEAQIRMQKLQQATREVEDTRERSLSPVEMAGDDFGAGQRAFMDSIRLRSGRAVIVSHPRTANNHKELTVVRGEYLEVLDDSKKWWKARNWKGQVAHVPHTILSEIEPPAYHGNERDRAASWTPPQSTTTESDVEEAPLPPSPPSRVSSEDSRRGERPKSEDLMQAELKDVLYFYREKRNPLEIHKTPEVYISAASPPSEVKSWLEAKGFSDAVVKALAGWDGNDLFSLRRDELHRICGDTEGKRLHSQITISRNVSGFKTTRSSELLDVLAKARAKAEGKSGIGPKKESISSTDDRTQVNTRNNAAKSRPPLKLAGTNGSPSKSPAADNKREEKKQERAPTKSKDQSKSKAKPHPPKPPPPPVDNHQDDDDFSTDDDSLDGKSTLGRMIRERRGQIFKK